MTVMTIAGFDPSGGAGVLNDIKTFHALQEYGIAVITTLTAQNIENVVDVVPVDVKFIEEQIDVVLEEEEIVYAKTGMLYSSNIVKAVANKVKEYQLKLVVDPVMIAGSGGSLSQEDLADSLRKYLLPHAVLTTPNVFEAQTLSGMEINDEVDAIEAALEIGKLCNVVVTGGHLKGNDILYNCYEDSIKVLEGELIASENTHGSGCTYSAAAAAYLLKGCNMEDALVKAGEFTRNSIKYGIKGTLDQFWKFGEH